MGRCAEFGPQIKGDCRHSMVAGASACTCPGCGVQCDGLFRGCEAVWANGPVDLPPLKQAPPPAPVHAPEPAPSAPKPPSPSAEAHRPPPDAGNGNGAGAGAAANRISAFLTAVADLREDLRRLREIVDRQSTPDPGLQRMAELLDELPARVSAAVMATLADVAAARTAERATTITATAEAAIRRAPQPPA